MQLFSLYDKKKTWKISNYFNNYSYLSVMQLFLLYDKKKHGKFQITSIITHIFQ